jgi:hypothetical protein
MSNPALCRVPGNALNFTWFRAGGRKGRLLNEGMSRVSNKE